VLRGHATSEVRMRLLLDVVAVLLLVALRVVVGPFDE
jgi:hypothetical protein